ncbi:MAG: hypothetical protein OXU79_18685 [Gemmatimonadota bacterium]|nr:hypothetical protein [Gemmatimonadota bacterium]
MAAHVRALTTAIHLDGLYRCPVEAGRPSYVYRLTSYRFAKKIPDFHAEIRVIANHAAEARVNVTFSQIHEEIDSKLS